ncbi:hypothetical protein ACFC4S_34465 [Priestia megaterium]|uniref:hypothetical protein n=1 Tax=Priestia megaterium TaxID=1404 RepID=UPI0035DFAF23
MNQKWNKWLLAVFSCLLVGSLIACTNKPTSGKEDDFSIKKVNVTITTDPNVVGETGVEDEKGKMVDTTPKTLYYEFVMKKNGKNNFFLTKGDSDEEVDAKIIPSQELKEASEKIVGVNLFSGNHDGLARGVGIEDFSSFERGKLELLYEVGAAIQTKDIPLAPSDKKLKKLVDVANKGTLVIYRNKKEIARYSMETLKPEK